MGEMLRCDDCGQPMAGSTICPACGWDLTASVAPPRRSLVDHFLAGGWRIVLYGLLVALPVIGFMRLRTTGPASDLATTLQWMVRGDDGRAAELETIHRSHEISSAAARYAVEHLEPPSFDGDWQTELEGFATMYVRGWMPLLFYGATTEMTPASVREIFTVRSVDGWGRPYRVTTRSLPRGTAWLEDEEVVADLRRGLQSNFFVLDSPDVDDGSDWLRMDITSAGRDGDFDTGDDLRFVSYIPVGFTIHLSRVDPVKMRRQLEIAYAKGTHYYRLEGSRWDLIDARLLAEYRLDSLL